MKILHALNAVLIGFYSSIKRFPVTIGFSTAASVIVIILTEMDGAAAQNTTDLLKRIAMILALGVPLSLCVQLGFERCGIASNRTKTIVHVAGAALLVLYFLFLLPDFHPVSIIRYVAFNLALYLAFVILPYFYKRERFERYAITLSVRFLITGVYSAVLFAGIAIILFTINKLLAVAIPETAYFNVFVLISGVFAPCFFLAGIPAGEQTSESNDYSKPLKILLLNIVIPLIIAYTAILYIYFAKIIVTLQWPEGLVGHLVLWYSIVSIGVVLYITPLRGENKWARMFISGFPKIILPILVMMFISIGIRIDSYGVTENRYFVVAVGLWVWGTMIYWSLVKKPRNIMIFLALACIAILSVAGPWSAFSISKFSQNQRFERILLKHDMIRDNAIVKPAVAIPNTDKKEISQIISYFYKSHHIQDLHLIPKDFKTGQMESVFGFPYEPGQYGPAENEFFYFNASPSDKPVSIKGYDYLIDLRGYEQETGLSENDLAIQYDNKNEDARIRVLYQGTSIYDKPLASFIKQLSDAHMETDNKEIKPEEATFTDQTDRIELTLIVANVNGTRNRDTGQLAIKGMDGYILVKIK